MHFIHHFYLCFHNMAEFQVLITAGLPVIMYRYFWLNHNKIFPDLGVEIGEKCFQIYWWKFAPTAVSPARVVMLEVLSFQGSVKSSFFTFRLLNIRQLKQRRVHKRVYGNSGFAKINKMLLFRSNLFSTNKGYLFPY